MWSRCFLAFLAFSLVFASPKPQDECCTVALRTGANLNKDIPSTELRCGQSYSQNLSPAPDISVPISWWYKHCGGWAGFNDYRSHTWFSIIVIVTKALFAISILQKRIFLIGSFIAIDTITRILSTMLMCGPIVLSSLHETMLDYVVLRYLYDLREGRHSLKSALMIETELLTAVIAGNWKKTSLTGHPPEHIKAIIHARSEPTDKKVRGLIEARPSFVSRVSAPIIMCMAYLFYRSDAILNTENDLSFRGLAFTVWWLGTCVLIVVLASLSLDFYPRLSERAGNYEDTWVRSRLFSSPAFVSRATGYERNWAWDRYTSKMQGIQCTNAWKDPCFRKQLITVEYSWPLILVAALLLTITPSALALFIESTIVQTPGEENISRVIISYTCAQFLLILYFAQKVPWPNTFDNQVVP